MGHKKLANKQAPPEGPSSARYSSSPSDSEEDEQVTYPAEERESPVQESDSMIQAVALPPKKPNSGKRPMQESEKNDAAESSRKTKKAKRVAAEEAAEKNKTLSVNGRLIRLWSEADEVLILEGLMNFPSLDMTAFFEYMKNSLSVVALKEQFVDKVRKLKKKFKKNVSRAAEADQWRPHERKCFELSKRVWGGNNNGGGVNESNRAGREENKENEVDGIGRRRSTRARSNIKLNDAVTLPEVGLGEGSKGRERKEMKVDEVEHFWAMHPCLKKSISDDSSMKEPLKSLVMEEMTGIGGGEAKALEKKWKDLMVEEQEIYLKRVDLMREQTKLALHAAKASKA